MSHLSFILILAWQGLPAQNAADITSPASVRPQLTPEQRGDIFMARKMYREAIDTYREAPETAISTNKIGIAYHQLTDLNSAARCYQRAIKLDPKFTQAINNLGTIYYSRQSYRRAIGQYKKVLRITPESPSTLANLGSAYLARKQYELASENYQKALAIDPHIFEHHGGVGTTVRDQTVGDRPTFFYYLARSYAKAGMKDQALNYIRKSIEEGFKERKKFIDDPEFAGLQKDPEFQKIMESEPKVL
jgi:tetratricopeptide (TPR) repeat protein